MTTATATGARVFPSHTHPNQPRQQVASAQGTNDAWWEPTRLDASVTAPAMRKAFERFSEALDPAFVDHVLLVGNPTGESTILSAVARLSSPVVFISVGAVPDRIEIADEMADVLHVFDRLQNELGLSQKELLAITGIRRRTYYSWKTKPASSRPRLSSLGDLWRLVDAVADLHEVVGGFLGQWIHGAREREKALRERRFDDLIDLALSRAVTPGRSFGGSGRIGVAADVELPIVPSGRGDARDEEDELEQWG